MPHIDDTAALLAKALKVLARGRGVQSDDLIVLLSGELAILRDAWDIDIQNGDVEARRTVRASLIARVGQITPPRRNPRGRELDLSDRQMQFKQTVLTIFNAADTELTRLNQGRRYAWLDSPDRGPLRINPATARRDFNYAVECIAQYLASRTVEPDPRAVSEVPRNDNDTVDNRRVPIIVGASILIIVLIGAVFILWPTPETTGDRSTSNSTSATETSSANPLGRDLNINVQSVSDPHMAGGIAFPVDQAAAAAPYLRLAMPQYDLLMGKALDDGAYLLGGVRLDMQLTSASGKSITVYKIRPIHKREAVVQGTVIRGHTEGAAKDQIDFVLDSPAPIAQLTDGYGKLLGPYFNQRTVLVDQNTSPNLTLTFNAYQAAYQFTVEIEYTVDGRNYSQVFDRSGQPFRATADLCMSQAQRAHLSDTDVTRLSALRYQAVRVVDATPDGTQYQYVTKEPDAFAEQCLITRPTFGIRSGDWGRPIHQITKVAEPRITCCR